MRNQLKRTPARALRSLAALMMVLCLIVGMIPMAFAAESAGSKPGDLTPSETKVYIKLSNSVDFFTGELAGQGTVIKPVAGSVCQLISDDWYTGSDGKEYYGVYYLNKAYNVLKSDVAADIMTPAELETYITETLWKQTVYPTLRKSMELVGDVRVHGLQVALKKLGYYSGALDGVYGKQTHDAVAKFQRQKGLDADGSAGPLTQPVLYALAGGTSTGGSGSSSSGSGGSSTTTTPTTGTLRTIASVNLRKYGNIKSDRLGQVPKNVNLAFTDTYKDSAGITWYQVRYSSQTGWVMGTYVTVTSGGSSSGSTGSVSSIGTLRTNVVVNLRKYASKGSARLDQVPGSLSLSYTDTHTDSNGVTWYEVRYGGQTGWLMGTFVTVTSTSGGSSSGSTGSVETPIGKVTITMPSTRVRNAPSGDKTGYVLSKGSKVDLLAMPVTDGGYTWYKIRTSSGLVGYVRGDCAKATIGSSSDDLVASTDKSFVKLPANTVLFTTETKPATGGVTVPANTVLMMYSNETYEVGGVKYLSLYHNNQKYNAVYAEVSSGIMTGEEVSAYMKALLDGTLASSLKRELDLVGDVRVYALQVALQRLQLNTGKLDGTFGEGTQSAVRNFQRSAKITVDGACGNETWTALRAKINSLGSSGTGSGSGSGDSGSSNMTVADFFAGATSVQKVVWDGDGKDMLPRSTYATVLDVQTKKTFRVYRWAGAYHADCVPASKADTKTMCEIVNFTYRDEAPSSSHLANIIRYSKGEVTGSAYNYAWPDFGGHVYNHDIGAAWDRRSVLVRPEGSSKIYAVSIYGYPHGYEGGNDSFSNAKFPNGLKFHEHNNFYGMMCLHFVNSKTHGGNAVDSDHQNAIDFAYNWAKNNGYSSLCK